MFDSWGVNGDDYFFFANHRLAEDGVDIFEVESIVGNPVSILSWRGTYAPDRVFLGPAKLPLPLEPRRFRANWFRPPDG